MSGKSRIEKILENLLGENNVIEPPIGRDEKILYSILNDLEYTDPPHSIFEDLLLAIKNGSSTETEYVYDNLVRDEKILFCKLNRREYFEPPHSRLERLLIKWLYLDLYLNIDGVPPFTFVSNGSPIIDYTIEGNTVLSGTPTHDSPIMPQGTGERTNNLFDKTDILSGYEIVNNRIVPNSAWGVSDYIPVEQGKYYIATNTGGPVLEYEAIGGTAVRSGISIVGRNYTPSATTRFIRINFRLDKLDDVMLNSGSTALPYEPYGYKIPISSASTTTPIYLGEVLSTRRIKKLVFTGEENFVYDSNYTRFRFAIPNSLILGTRRTPVICTHYETLTDGRPIEDVPKNTIYSDSIRQNRWWIKAEDFTSANDFKAYLAEQYAAGTPVTIWYILTEPETAIVNEPLMKIGDYADSISYEQTVVSIPTVSGRNTFDVLGDVKPSNVELTYAPRAPLLGKRKTVLKK